jgi:hypothetical protein
LISDFTNGFFVTNWCGFKVFEKTDFGQGAPVDYTNGGIGGMIVTICKDASTDGDVMWQSNLPRAMITKLNKCTDGGIQVTADEELHTMLKASHEETIPPKRPLRDCCMSWCTN